MKGDLIVMKKVILSFILLCVLLLVSCSSEVKVKFNSDGGSEVSAIVVDETGIIEEPAAPTKSGYMFLGWYSKDELFDFSKPITKSVTLKAKWAKSVTLILSTPEGESEFLAPLNNTYDLPVPERNGFFFVGWEDVVSGEMIESDYVFTEDLYLEAKWQKKETYTINYMYNSQSLKSELIYEGDEYVPYVYELKGHSFKGWYTDTTFTKLVDFDNLGRSNYAYAKMEANVYNVSFSHSDKTIGVSYGQRIGNLPKVNVPFCTFGGWEYNGQVVTDITTFLFEGDIELQAILYTTSTFVIEGNSGTKVEYKIGDTTPYIQAVKEGYTFAGWYSNPNFTGEPIYIIEDESYANKTLYAKWVMGDTQDNAYGTKIVDMVKSYYEGLLSGKTIYEDIDFSKNDPFYGASLVWESSNTSALLSDGRVFRTKYNENVDITLSITYGKVTETITFPVIIKAKPYQDLSQESVVGSYVYTGTYNNRPVDDILLDTANIIFLAFVNLNSDGTLVPTVDFLTKYNSFKEKAYDAGVRVVFSIGGAGGADIFESIALDDYTRSVFVENCVNLIKEHDFAGVDIDWEYPTEKNAEYYTILMKDLYTAVKAYDKELLVTSAIPAGPWGHYKFDLSNSHNYLDYINLMSYDLQVSNNGGKAYHHSALYKSDASNGYKTYGMCSVEETVNYWNKNYGVPYNKVVIGAAFYGRMSTLTGLNGVITSDGDCGASIRYNIIKNDYLSKSTVTEYWDDSACAPWLYDTATGTFISYDNPRSIEYKCDYVKTKGVAGIFWWDYGSDSTGDLINAVNGKLDVLENK